MKCGFSHKPKLQIRLRFNASLSMYRNVTAPRVVA